MFGGERTRVSVEVFVSTLVVLVCPFLFGVPRAAGETDWSDVDQDGFSELQENAVGTDPEDSRSHPTLADNRHKIAGYWSLTNNTKEVFGSGCDGVLRNGAGFRNGSLFLDGRDDYVSFGNESVFNISSNISFCLWVRPDFTHQLKRALGKFSIKKRDRSYAFFFLSGRLWAFLSDDGSCRNGHTILKATRRPVVERDVWKHVGVTWSSTNGSEGIAIYIDAMETDAFDVRSAAIKNVHAGTADLCLGAYDVRDLKRRRTYGFSGRRARPQSAKEIVRNAFRGSMAHLVICGDTLSEIEMAEIYLLGPEGNIKTYVQTDFDEDGMVDYWERTHFGDVSHAAEDDSDNDGLTNLAEMGAGTDPGNVDTDGDGVSDGTEMAAGTNPLDSSSFPQDPDQDNDGLPDWWEIAHLGNLDSSAGQDPDDDGLPNSTEYEAGTNPSVADTDRDGMSDGWEVENSCDPLTDDSSGDPDQDGWSNLIEFTRGGNPNCKWVADTNNALRLVVVTPFDR